MITDIVVRLWLSAGIVVAAEKYPMRSCSIISLNRWFSCWLLSAATTFFWSSASHWPSRSVLPRRKRLPQRRRQLGIRPSRTTTRHSAKSRAYPATAMALTRRASTAISSPKTVIRPPRPRPSSTRPSASFSTATGRKSASTSKPAPARTDRSPTSPTGPTTTPARRV